MKIALIGSQGTGKTTLARGLFDKLYPEMNSIGLKIGLLGEIARLSPFPINEDTTKESQKWIIGTQYTKELELKEKYDFLICDRSVLDGYAYYHNKFGRDKLSEELVKEHIKSYDLLFKLPINKDYLIDDGVRSTNLKFQEDIDNAVDFLLKKFNIDYLKHENLNKTLDLIYNKWNDLKSMENIK